MTTGGPVAQSQDLHPVLHAPNAVAANGLAHRRDEKAEANRIGEETRRDEQRSGDEDHRTVRQVGAGEHPGRQRLLNPAELAATLAAARPPITPRGGAGEAANRHDDAGPAIATATAWFSWTMGDGA